MWSNGIGLSLILNAFLVSELSGRCEAIVNGDDPDRFSHPWATVLRLRNFDFNMCSGTLVDRRWVVTNAHCIDFVNEHATPLTPVSVIVGAHDLLDDKEQGRQTINVEAMYKHPEYDDYTLAHDIGLLRLSKPARVGQKTIAAVPGFASASDFIIQLKEKRRCFVYAWGTQLTDNNRWRGDVNPISRVSVRLFRCDGNKDRNPFQFPDDQICYKSRVRGSGICGGDSGGTVVCRHHGRWLLTAANSFNYSWQGNCRNGLMGGILIYKNLEFLRNITGLPFQ